jgi:hypothetical protein
MPVAAQNGGAAAVSPCNSVRNRTTDMRTIDADETLSFDARDGDARHEIASLETRLEELAEALARCRKFRLASQIAMAGGGFWLVAAVIGIIGFDSVAMIAAIAGVIGGIVMYGSNSTTAEELAAEMKEAEAKRASLIGALDLRVVSRQEPQPG